MYLVCKQGIMVSLEFFVSLEFIFCFLPVVEVYHHSILSVLKPEGKKPSQAVLRQ